MYILYDIYIYIYICIYTHTHTLTLTSWNFSLARSLSLSLSRWRGDSIGRVNSLRETAEITREIRFHWETAAPRGSRAISSRPPRLRRYRLIKRSMLLEHVKFALARRAKGAFDPPHEGERGGGRGNGTHDREYCRWQGEGRGCLRVSNLFLALLFF